MKIEGSCSIVLLVIIFFQAEVPNEQLQVYYKVCYARVLDYRRKFIEAAQRYNELSYKVIIHEDERMTALRNALICTVLASAGSWTLTYVISLLKQRINNYPFSIIFRTAKKSDAGYSVQR